MRDRERRHRRSAIMNERCATPRPRRPSSESTTAWHMPCSCRRASRTWAWWSSTARGSSKESHFDFARGCRADGMAALAYDARGHGALRRQLRTRRDRRRTRHGRAAARRTLRAWRCAGRAWAASRPSTPVRATHRSAPSWPSAPAPEDLACCASSARARNWSSGATPRRASPGSSRSTSDRGGRAARPGDGAACSCTRAATSRCRTR